jgi:hypothetical protein
MYGGMIAATGTISRHRRIAPDRLAERVRDHLVGRQMQRVHYGRGHDGGKTDRGRVEGMVVNDVVTVLADDVVDVGEGTLRDRGRAGGSPSSPIYRRGEVARIDSCIDHVHAQDL